MEIGAAEFTIKGNNMRQRDSFVYVLSILAACAVVLTAVPRVAYSETQGMERRDERRDDRGDARDTRQEGRDAARDAKDACKDAGESRSECRQEKRDTKQDARGDARDIKRGGGEAE